MAGRLTARRTLIVTMLAGTVLLGISFVRGTPVEGQGATLVRGNAPGEWRYWGADAWSTRYSPLDQINAATSTRSGRVAVECRRVRQRRVLPHDAALRERPALHRRHDAPRAVAIDPETGETLWMWALERASAGRKRRASSPDAASRTGPTAQRRARHRRDARLSPGARSTRRPGVPDPKFGKNGVVDLMDGLGFPLVPLAVDDDGSLIISDAAPARKAKPGETWDRVEEDRRRRHRRHRSGATARSPPARRRSS